MERLRSDWTNRVTLPAVDTALSSAVAVSTTNGSVWREEAVAPLQRGVDGRNTWDPQAFLRTLGERDLFARNQIDELVAAGCDRDELVFYLCQLDRLRGCRIPPRKTLSAYAAAIERTAKTMTALTDMGEPFRYWAGHFIDTDPVLAAACFQSGLDDLSTVLRDLSEHAIRQPNELIDAAKAAIVKHVRAHTGRYHDAEVATVVQAACRGDWLEHLADAQKMWRVRKLRAYKDETVFECWRRDGRFEPLTVEVAREKDAVFALRVNVGQAVGDWTLMPSAAAAQPLRGELRERLGQMTAPTQPSPWRPFWGSTGSHVAPLAALFPDLNGL